MTQRISQDPDPCIPGQKVRFCVDLDGASVPIVVTGAWDPQGQQMHHTVTSPEDRCWDEVVPADAEGGHLNCDDGTEEFGVLVA